MKRRQQKRIAKFNVVGVPNPTALPQTSEVGNLSKFNGEVTKGSEKENQKESFAVVNTCKDFGRCANKRRSILCMKRFPSDN